MHVQVKITIKLKGSQSEKNFTDMTDKAWVQSQNLSAG